MSQIAPSILSCDFAKLGEEIQAVEKAGADLIHVDVMDGHFVPNLTLGPVILKCIRPVTKLPLDVHLMISSPGTYLEAFAEAGADIISVHVEASDHLDRDIWTIKQLGKKAGVAINPATSLFTLDYILEIVDQVIVMTVNPGFGGQSMIESCVQKIRVLEKRMERIGRDIPIVVDGGVNLETIHELSEAGARVFVTGSALFSTSDYKKTIDAMRAALKK